MKFRRYEYGNCPDLVPVEPALNWDEAAVIAAGFDPEDEEVTCCRLTEKWNGHDKGSLIVSGLTITGYPFVVFEVLVD